MSLNRFHLQGLKSDFDTYSISVPPEAARRFGHRPWWAFYPGHNASEQTEDIHLAR
jgi:hypothetical protein